MSSRINTLSGVIVIAAVMSGCASAPSGPVFPNGSANMMAPTSTQPKFVLGRIDPVAPEPRPRPDRGGDMEEEPGTKLIAVTQLSSANDSWGDPSEVGSKFNGMYTKLVIRTKGVPLTAGTASDPDNVEYLPYTKRNWLKRALLGYDFSVTLTAKLAVKDSIDITVPLAVLGHSSNSDGETWVREMDLTRSDFPLFLFRSDGTSVPSLTLEVKGSKSTASKGAAAAVSAITGIAKLAGADPVVITTLTKASTKAATQEVDNAISKLFSSSVTERFVSDRDLKLWAESNVQTPRGLVVDLNLPSSENDWNVTNRQPIATWILTFANPRPSVFHEWSVCSEDRPMERCSKEVRDAEKVVSRGVKPADILHFRLVPTANGLGQIDAYLRQQKWFTDASVALARGDANVPAAKNMFCQNVVDSMTSLGLNQFDGELVLWAVDTGMPTGFPALDSAKCTELLKPIRDDRSARS